MKPFLLSFLTLSMLLAACQTQQPPLPTIVSVTSTTTAITQSTYLPIVIGKLPSPAAATTTAIATIMPSATFTPTVMPTATLTPVVPLIQLKLGLELVTTGLTKPLYLTHAHDQRIFIVQQKGQVLALESGQEKPTPFLDIQTRVGSQGNEQGLLSIAFHPDYQTNGFFYVNYTDLKGSTVIARYQVSTDPGRADEKSETILLTIPQPYANHNGGHILFGSDGYLYVGMGDGGAANDPHNHGQSLDTLLGKILRLDVNHGVPYGVPSDNPFINTPNTRPEIWSYGWRNPWRLAFDTETGDLYVADVGQNQYEEVHVELAGSQGGQNYGWRLMEASHCFNPTTCNPAELGVVMPVAEYPHSQGCSVTGGYVYRGQKFPQLTGVYIYADYCTGTVWGLRHEADGAWSQAKLLDSGKIVSSFGLDSTGEMYLLDHRNGEVWQVIGR